jgi:hypothetical protein
MPPAAIHDKHTFNFLIGTPPFMHLTLYTEVVLRNIYENQKDIFITRKHPLITEKIQDHRRKNRIGIVMIEEIQNRSMFRI